MSAHTPTPWSNKFFNGVQPTIILAEVDGRKMSIANTAHDPMNETGDKEVDKANADFIVLAANCHEELIKLLEWSLEELSPDDFKDRGGEEFSLYERIQAAVTKAKGE